MPYDSIWACKATLEFLAKVLITRGEVTETTPLLGRALKERLARIGDTDPELLPLLDSLSAMYVSEKRYSDAEAPLVRAIRMAKKRKSDNPNRLPVLLGRYHSVLDSLGRDEEAAKVAKQIQRLAG